MYAIKMFIIAVQVSGLLTVLWLRVSKTDAPLSVELHTAVSVEKRYEREREWEIPVSCNSVW